MTAEQTVQLSVDLTAPVPVYEQLRAQVAGHIGTGALRPGDTLPTLRRLAADLGIAVNTVARAYSELESAGLVRSGRRVGTIVTGSGVIAVPREVAAAAEQFALAAAASGVSEDTAVALLRQSLRHLRG